MKHDYLTPSTQMLKLCSSAPNMGGWWDGGSGMGSFSPLDPQ